jgi:hypothetical protein
MKMKNEIPNKVHDSMAASAKAAGLLIPDQLL